MIGVTADQPDLQTPEPLRASPPSRGAGTRSERSRFRHIWNLVLAVTLDSGIARGQLAGPPLAETYESPGAGGPADKKRLARDLETAPPPPSQVVYLQYGVAFTTEQVVAAGPMCDSTSIPCILGAGGGIAVRAGWRSTGPLYLGGAYELTKQDPNKLYRIALLQQARAEGRYYLMTARVTEPYAAVTVGAAGYGNEWAIDTWGPAASLGGGIEYQITQRTVVGLALAYRLLYFSRFTDTAGAERSPGIAQLVGLDLVLEQRDAVVRAGAGSRP